MFCQVGRLFHKSTERERGEIWEAWTNLWQSTHYNMRVRVAKVVKFQDNFPKFFLSSKRRKECTTLFDHFCRETFFLQKCMILYRMHTSVSRIAYCIFITPILKTISLFSRSFCQEILSLRIVSIQEWLVIKTGLWWCAMIVQKAF